MILQNELNIVDFELIYLCNNHRKYFNEERNPKILLDREK